MNSYSNILIVGQGGFVENALFAFFEKQKGARVFNQTPETLNFHDHTEVASFLIENSINTVFCFSVRSGGIEANRLYPAEFLYENLIVQTVLMEESYKAGVTSYIYVASSCIYPKECCQPISEDCYLTGSLEPTSESYSLAKLAGIQMVKAYRQQYAFNAVALIPATFYGPGQEEDSQNSHVLQALTAKFRLAVEQNLDQVDVWGTGNPRREFIHINDFCDACGFIVQQSNLPPLINIGFGEDISIKELAELIKKEIGFQGALSWDETKPDGVFQKLLDSSVINQLGWSASISLEEGLKTII